MNFNIKKFKNNILFFIVCISLLVVLSLLSFLADRSTKKLDKTELSDADIEVKSLVLNEIMTSNKGAIADEDGYVYDYVEIYNGSDKDINLNGYGLSDENTKVKYVFPNTEIKSHEYLIVFLSGTNKGGMHANFKLKSSGGEIVALLKPNGKVLDAIETIALDGNTVMARDAKGNWVNMEKATPGYSNNTEGYEAYLKSLLYEGEKELVINEVLAENKGNFKDSNGNYSGYIEIKNISNKSVNLANYGLSNEENVIYKWQFPSISLSSGEVLVVYTSGVSSKQGQLSASFKLKSKNGAAVLSNNKGKIIDKVKYENLANGLALIREENKLLENNSISPGYPNTVDGIKSFQKKYLTNPKGLMISEAMNSNFKYLAQNGGEYYDWIELYNNGSDTIKLSDYCLTTSTNTMCMYKLPEVELKKGEYYVVMASGNEKLSTSKYKHTNFKLSANEAIYITSNSKIIDSMYMANVPLGYSMGRGSSYGIYYFSTPTPKAKNGDGSVAVSYLPSASVASGQYNDGKNLKVTLNGNGNIYYTLDGSKPTTSSKKYSSPLTIKKTTVLRIMSKESGKIKSDTQTYSYIMNEKHKLPVLSLAINKSDLNNVNSHTSLNSSVIEPVVVELIEKDNTGFKINGGLKLFGGSTRSYRKKSYEVKFKKKYGDSHLEYNLFDTVDSNKYESIVLRTGSQDEFQWSKRVLIRDIVATSLVDEYTNVDVQAYKPVAMYINGSYWGLYFIREKVDENFVANHYNVNATESNTDLLRIDGEVKSGSSKNYRNMISFIKNNSLSNKSNYEKIKNQVDIENLCDFWIAEMWSNNYDIINVRYFRNPNVDNGKWKFVFYDLDSAFYNYRAGQYGIAYYARAGGIWNYNSLPTTLLNNLMKNSDFRKTFLERLSYNLKNTWSSKNFSKKIDDVIKEISEDEIKRNLDRWDVISYSGWKSNVSNLKGFAKLRNKAIVEEAKSYFNLSSAEVKKYFGDVK